MINYIELFSGYPLNIIPEFTKECAKNEVWHIYSDYIRKNITQDNIKISYLLVLESYKNFCLTASSEEKDTFEMYLLHIDILWQALTDENCAKIEFHINQ